MPLTTKLTQRLGIQHPIIQGGMHYVGYAPLAAAVSNAGAIGVITALTQPNAEALRSEIHKTRSLLRSPDTPIGVNLTVLPQLNSPDYPAIVQVLLDEKVARRAKVRAAALISSTCPLLSPARAGADGRDCGIAKVRRAMGGAEGQGSKHLHHPQMHDDPALAQGPATRLRHDIFGWL